MHDIRRVRLRIYGHVQGVNFRFLARRQAQSLGVSGWIRNLAGGWVEAEAAGSPDRVEAFLTWCRHGPSGARVDRLEVEEGNSQATLSGFQIR